jgi:hypothetical protein
MLVQKPFLVQDPIWTKKMTHLGDATKACSQTLLTSPSRAGYIVRGTFAGAGQDQQGVSREA